MAASACQRSPRLKTSGLLQNLPRPGPHHVGVNVRHLASLVEPPAILEGPVAGEAIMRRIAVRSGTETMNDGLRRGKGLTEGKESS